MTKVSLIVPVYRAEPWIAECMASIRAQTYKDIELIVIDDSQASGAAAARNRGLDKATGEFIAFCDADDYMEPDAIEKMVAAMDGVGLVCGSFRKFGDFEQIVTHPTETLSLEQVADYVMENLRNPRSHQMLSGCWAKLYRRELVEHFPILTTAEDMAFNFDYLIRCYSYNVRFISNIVYNNRKHAGTLTTTFDAGNKSGLFGFLSALRYVRHFLEICYRGDEIESAIDNAKVYHSILYFTRICAQAGEPINHVFKKLYP